MKKYFLLFSMVAIFGNASENLNLPYKNKLKIKEEKVLKEFKQKRTEEKISRSNLAGLRLNRVIKAKRELF
ncbi:MAG: hypothetical protein ACOYT8_02945 [Candidatus Dependentiae bacterium]